jgi:hypothetical protein
VEDDQCRDIGFVVDDQDAVTQRRFEDIFGPTNTSLPGRRKRRDVARRILVTGYLPW